MRDPSEDQVEKKRFIQSGKNRHKKSFDVIESEGRKKGKVRQREVVRYGVDFWFPLSTVLFRMKPMVSLQEHETTGENFTTGGHFSIKRIVTR